MNFELAFYILAGYVVFVWLITFFAKTWKIKSILFSYSNPLLVLQKCYRDVKWKIKMKIKEFKQKERKVRIKKKHIIEKEYRVIINDEYSNPQIYISYKLDTRKKEPKLINMRNIVPLVFIREDLKDDIEVLEKANKIFKIVKYAKKEIDIEDLYDLIIGDKNIYSHSVTDKTANYIEIKSYTLQNTQFKKRIEKSEEERVKKLKGEKEEERVKKLKEESETICWWKSL